MDLKDASRMVLTESAPHADLHNVTQAVYDDYSAGREVPSIALTGMLAEASRRGVLLKLKQRHGDHAVNDMITVLAHEIDRQRPDPGNPALSGR
ncbi:hypothetical protein OG417_09280 [Actinoallomurus sp. NBC_01490]|jgi:hypothetical protein|uniref:hypothetical protein n=1 Tax=Actinoallomurus sp. NBC_01490 TaxID=2903557 RepID=UPI002E2F523E|nr:hypothetical protein [Actinoallomurus sp. NBC_01490]